MRSRYFSGADRRQGQRLGSRVDGSLMLPLRLRRIKRSVVLQSSLVRSVRFDPPIDP